MKKRIKEWLDGIYISDEVKIGAVMVAGVVVAYIIGSIIDKKKQYKEAADLYANGEYAKARGLFRDLGDYKLSKDYKALCTAALGDADEDPDEDDFFDDDFE